ncbi:gamma-glutamyltranspeptidase [Vibrio ishigakensis]|uniref:Gamma-glutamyltranspeptidase n=1 Tax=Vibrio ishigakensis TaxID=1481914 RepID=A0A0B8P9P2_9VIBR|nr:gamma-glutamyltranspeptidase [Vibrio ishigakensis]
MSATPTMFLGEDGKAIRRNEILGPKSVAIPGTLKLLYTTHQKHGSLPWKSLIEPAIQYAKQGYAMNSYTFDILVRESARLVEDPEIKQLYWQDNQVKPAGTLMTNPKLALTLEEVAEQGDNYMYQGDLAKRIVETVNERLGDNPHKLSVEDFASYQVVERKAVQSDYHNHKVVSFGYPASGGVLVSQALTMLEGHDLSQYPITDAEPWRLMVESMRLAKADRIAYAGDPSFISDPTAKLLDETYLKQRAALIPARGINQDVSSGSIYETAPAIDESFESQDTGHISIVDGKGNAIAMTSTVGTGWALALWLMVC